VISRKKYAWQWISLSASQILREFNFQGFGSLQSAIFAVLEPLNFEIWLPSASNIAKISFTFNSEPLQTHKMTVFDL